MNVKNKLHVLTCYFSNTRQVGHTEAMINGAKNTPNSIVLAHNEEMARLIRPRIKNGIGNNEVIVTADVEKLHGIHRPLLIDNAELYMICNDALSEISRLENELYSLRKLYDRQREKIRVFESNIEEIQHHKLQISKCEEKLATLLL